MKLFIEVCSDIRYCCTVRHVLYTSQYMNICHAIKYNQQVVLCVCDDNANALHPQKRDNI